MQNVFNARRWLVVALLFVASSINYLDRATLSVALPLISADFGLDPKAKGLLLSSFFWSYALMQVPVGWLADRRNLRWLYAGMFALWSLACGLSGLAGSVVTFVALRILLGFGESIYLPAGSKVVSVFFAPHERGLPSGIFDSGTRAGLALGSPLVAWLIVQFGWRNMFFLVGFGALLWLLPWLLVFPKHNEGGDRTHHEAELAERRPRRGVTIDKNLVGICLGFFCFGYFWYFLVTWLPDFLVTARHMTLLKAGIYASLPYLVFGVSMPVGGWIADVLIRSGFDRTRTRKGIVTVAFLTGIFLVPAALVTDTRAAIAMVSAASLVGLAPANLLVILQDCAPPKEVGLWTGIENFVGNLAGIVAPWLTGYLIARTGSYTPGFALAAITLVTGLLAYWIIVGELKPFARDPA